jgi:murein DD-endopeptidase MepM/ murein hydrolase activator NlpD
MKLKILCLLLISLFITPYTLANIEKNQKKLDSIQQKIKKNKSILIPKKKKKQKAQIKLNQLTRKIKYNVLKLNNNKRKLTFAIKNEKKARKEYIQTQSENKKLQKKLKHRISYLYKHSPLSALELILSTNKWNIESNSIFFFTKILEKDIEIINLSQESLKKLDKKKKLMKKRKKYTLKIKKDIQNRENYLLSQKKQQAIYISKLEKEIKKLLNQNIEFDRLSNDLSKLISKEAQKKGYYGTGKYIKPVNGWISSRYGIRVHPIFKRKIKHTGIDIAAPKGRKIRAADSGKIIFAGTKGGYGKSVLIFHGTEPISGKTFSTFYAHQSRIFVKKGDLVQKGDEIGWVGSTGYATGPHLHFELKINGIHVDPLKYVPR